MKNKTELDPKNFTFDPAIKGKPKKSLRPMRSMVAVRSLKPKTSVATLSTVRIEQVRELT